MYLIPNATVADGADSFALDVSIPTLSTLVHISGDRGAAADIRLEGLTFTHTRRTLLDEYTVPSAGDWSVRASGAVTASGEVRGLIIEGCTFNRTGGNAIVLRGAVQGAAITKTEMELLGDSAVVLIGELPGLGNNGSDAVWRGAAPSYPRDTLIAHNHFHGLGVWGKQSAALFQAVSCRTNFSHNVAYNGPRAAININDGFCGGSHLENNVLFNWVRETQDHGPINTWDRQGERCDSNSRGYRIQPLPQMLHPLCAML
eukprot:7390828-Prymnesium_polylepis.1